MHRTLVIISTSSALLGTLLMSTVLGEAPKPVRDPQRTFQKDVVSWTELRDQNVVKQKQDYSCGAAAVATVLRYYWGQDVLEGDVLDTLSISLTPAALEDRTKNGLTMADLKVVCDRMGYAAAVGKLDNLQKLSESKVPLVVSVKMGGTDHFVVYRGMAYGMVFLADPFRGNTRVAESDFVRYWNDNAVFVVAPEGKTSSAVSRLDIRPEEVQLAWLNRQVIRRKLSSGN